MMIDAGREAGSLCAREGERVKGGGKKESETDSDRDRDIETDRGIEKQRLSVARDRHTGTQAQTSPGAGL